MGKLSLTDVVPNIPQPTIVDVGAMLLEGQINELALSGKARLIGFEPNAAECEKLVRTYGTQHRFLPCFVGAGGPATFYETNFTMTGSLYPPNVELLQLYNNLAEVVTLVRTHPVETVRLDDLDLGEVDFLKLDVQGAELDVLKGAERMLSAACIVQAEVEFVEIYKGQPLFGDVDQAIRAQGFAFHTFSTLSGRSLKPIIFNDNPNRGLRQWLWADAVYIRSILDVKKMPAEKMLKMALLLHDEYQSFDFCYAVLREFDARNGTDHAARYFSALQAHGLEN